MVFGHFHPALYDGVEAFRLTFLRHPVDNVLSIYSFWKTQPYHGAAAHKRFLIEHPSPLEFSRYIEIMRLMSDTFFGSYDMNRFDFIGFEETRTADLVRLSALIGADITADVHLNKTEYSDEDEFYRTNEAIRGKISDVVRDDINFYEAARRIAQSHI